MKDAHPSSHFAGGVGNMCRQSSKACLQAKRARPTYQGQRIEAGVSP